MLGLQSGKYCIFLSLFLLHFVAPVKAQSYINSTNGGYPYIQHFTAEEYKGAAQNWTIVQANNGFIYVGNNLGVLEYDGANWRLIETPDKGLIRSLTVHHDGSVYVSAIGDLGVLKPDSSGAERFQSLRDLLPPGERTVDDVLRVMSLRDGVYFQTRDRLIRIHEDTSTIWRPSSTITSSFVLDNRVYLKEQERGLVQLKNDTLVVAPGGTTFRNMSVIGVFLYDDTSFLVMTQRNGMFLCGYELESKEPCEVFRPDLLEKLAGIELYAAKKLPDGSFVIGSYGDGLFFMSASGDIKYWLTEEDGLSSNAVSGFGIDREYGLWLATGNGIDRLSLRVPMTYFDETLGFDRMASGDMLRHEGTLYIAAFHGVFALSPDNQRFTRDTFIRDQCPALLSTRQGLLVGCRNGVYNLDRQRKIEAPHDIPTYNMFRPSWDSTRIYLGLRYGMAWLELVNETWTYGGEMDVPTGVYKMMEDSDGRVWISSIKDGVFLVDLKSPADSLRLTRYGPEHGVPPGLLIAEKLAGQVVFKVWDDSGVVIKPVVEGDSIYFVPHEVFEQIPESWDKRILNFVEDDQGRVWIFNREQSNVATPKGDGTYAYEPISLRYAGVYNAYSMFSESGTLWVGSPEGMIRVAKERAVTPGYAFPAFLRQISTPTDRVLFSGGATRQINHVVWPDSIKNLRFSFSAPQFDAPAKTTYRTRLDGLEPSWSAWTNATNRDFTNLSSGDYTFLVQAQNVYGTLSDVGTFSFEILPPWYQTTWAYIILGLLGLGTIVGVVVGYNHLQSRTMRARNKELEALVQERTESLAAAYEESQVMNENLITTNRKLEDQSDQLRKLLEANKEILGITAHDLKNPLGGIIGLAGMVIEDFQEGVDATYESAVNHIPMLKNEAERMLQIIKDLLDKHREGRNVTLTREKAMLADVVSAVLRWNAKEANSKGIELHYHAEANLLVNIDVLAIQRVLDNYVSNAIKYSPVQTNVWIGVEHLTTSEGGAFSKIAVRDEGPGLTEEDKQKVFGKMQRLSAKPTGGEHSTGLGLFIVKKLVEAHGGAVGVDSIHGEGATFWFTLPISDPEEGEKDLALQDRREAVYNGRDKRVSR